MFRATLIVAFQLAALVALAEVRLALLGLVADILAGCLFSVLLSTVLKWEAPPKVVPSGLWAIGGEEWPKAA
jgi:membrane protease YdiL (CAAX protease family)